MAYNSSYNPDALPAHAEPEQAAQILSAQTRPQDHVERQHNYNKPPPPLPRPDQGRRPPPRDDYDRRDPYRGGGADYGGRPPPQGGPRADYGGRGPYQNYGQSPPPAGYGYGAPPPGGGRQSARPPPQSVPAGADPTLYPLFQAVDKDGSGQLSEKELRSALVNGDFTQFDGHTVRMMIRMFDTDRSGTINFDEFCGLWGFLAAWRGLFDRFDEDRSGNISFDEYTNALVAFGYRLSPQFVQTLFKAYDKREENAISFDLFVQSCISLKRMTDVFKKYDDDRDGFITLSFEEFLTEILRQR
ncbi:MAG: hypothetical protein M1824_006604 [Vezdaea acicularis]|nr:MAG: hypothetical protein M1824_006604 [Vezdaea acicularis]